MNNSVSDSKKEQFCFSLGRIVITPGALTTLNQEDVDKAVYRHSKGDWGDCCAGDARENDMSVKAGFRILSVYSDRDKRKFWVITEADRSATTILLPEEY